MLWIVGALIVISIVLLIALNRSSLAPESQAADWIRDGAKVIDVRNESEFRQKHIEGALNVPLHDVRQQLAKHAPEKDKVLLLHCAAGGRSAIACRTARQLGYTRAYNLGSYHRAERVMSAARSKAQEGTTTPATPESPAASD